MLRQTTTANKNIANLLVNTAPHSMRCALFNKVNIQKIRDKMLVKQKKADKIRKSENHKTYTPI